MRTFSAFDGRPSVIEGSQRKKGISKKGRLQAKEKASRKPRPFISPADIRAKIQNKNDDIAAKKSNKVSPPSGANAMKAPMSADEASSKAKSLSDIGGNDPNHEDTKEKLKSALSMGSFAFSDKERQVLNSILKG